MGSLMDALIAECMSEGSETFIVGKEVAEIITDAVREAREGAMDMGVRELMAIAVSKKRGNKEFSLHYFEESPHWMAQIGNRSSAVLLGEINGEYKATSDTAEGAISDLIKAIDAGQKEPTIGT